MIQRMGTFNSIPQSQLQLRDAFLNCDLAQRAIDRICQWTSLDCIEFFVGCVSPLDARYASALVRKGARNYPDRSPETPVGPQGSEILVIIPPLGGLVLRLTH